MTGPTPSKMYPSAIMFRTSVFLLQLGLAFVSVVKINSRKDTIFFLRIRLYLLNAKADAPAGGTNFQ